MIVRDEMVARSTEELCSSKVARSRDSTERVELISLFSGCGGLDLGFKRAGFETITALDKNQDAIESYNLNFPGCRGRVADLSDIADAFWEQILVGVSPNARLGVIGGPPCQYFSRGNSSPSPDDPRRTLPMRFASIVSELNSKRPVDFFLFENVKNLASLKHRADLDEILNLFKEDFWIYYRVLNAVDYQVAQFRERFFVVGFNKRKYREGSFEFPAPASDKQLSVRDVLSDLPDPTFFSRELSRDQIDVHPNHCTIRPRSKKFRNGALGQRSGRSFRVLEWDRPSWTVAYGNREIHVHPNLGRRLSIFEALRLQGFPAEFELLGSLSSQVNQVSNAVPPPLAEFLALSIQRVLKP